MLKKITITISTMLKTKSSKALCKNQKIKVLEKKLEKRRKTGSFINAITSADRF